MFSAQWPQRLLPCATKEGSGRVLSVSPDGEGRNMSHAQQSGGEETAVGMVTEDTPVAQIFVRHIT